MATKKPKKTKAKVWTREERAIEAQHQKLKKARQGRSDGKRTRLGGPWVSDGMEAALTEFSRRSGMHKNDIIESLLSKLLRVN